MEGPDSRPRDYAGDGGRCGRVHRRTDLDENGSGQPADSRQCRRRDACGRGRLACAEHGVQGAVHAGDDPRRAADRGARRGRLLSVRDGEHALAHVRDAHAVHAGRGLRARRGCGAERAGYGGLHLRHPLLARPRKYRQGPRRNRDGARRRRADEGVRGHHPACGRPARRRVRRDRDEPRLHRRDRRNRGLHGFRIEGART